ncbi:rasGAP-activating-like protein 1 isoform X2 [Acipenser oxyrinchus oxyrinchus]|uniref:RasGAP-activating-like protein 1 isoform X2 n=1 Tax=Acipenser oxyrinchus oxyrinchus TaxID=40147 RepID=A0AAD8FWK5_ACIOX|nr:rasGAP-activating-like protein 1 isoform X2 [Acipenser oxyrinchus oxyrinchus]
MAKNTSLYFRIVEGRNLPAKDVSGTSDPYCIVKVDNEVVARTATVWKNLNPFWGEEYTLHLPMGFHSLSFYVMDEDTIGHDDVIGKISLNKEAIGSQGKGLDNWMNLTRVDPDEEVQGEIHLGLELLRDPPRTGLRCHVIKARDLAPRDISGSSDPFARILFNNRTAETSIIKKTRFPHWDEVLELELEGSEEAEGRSLTLEVWDWDLVGKNDFLGKVEIPLECLQRSPRVRGWFRLLPLGNMEDDAGGKLGALRLTIRLAEDRILPSMYYQPLIDLLVESVICPAEVEDTTPLTMLEEVTTVESRQDVAMTLVKIYLGQGLVVPFLDYLNMREVNQTSDPNTLFRSNSLASKAMEQFMKAVGMLYLHEVLKPIVNRIFDEKKYIELDPCKIELNRTRRIPFKGSASEAEVRESSLELLRTYLSDIMDSIVGSVAQCPPVMRVAFKQLHKRVEEQFPEAENEDVKYLAISGFLFLRFFAPAILTPKLFNLRDHHADTRTSRTLLLLAKAVQSIGNLGLQLGHGKEQWMAPLHPFILQSVSCVKDFLDKLIDIDNENVSEVHQRAVFLPSVTVKEGYLHKRKAEGPQLLTRFAFKKRYFWLSSETLSYAKSPDWQVRSSIPVQRICAVERVDENAFQQQNMMQVVTQDNDGQLHTMYILCKNVNALNQWLSSIRKASIYNERMLPSFHPGAYRSGKWSCCLQSDRTVLGCSRTHSAVTLGDWSDPLDPDAETQTIYRQLLQGRDKLRKKYLESADAETAMDQEERKHSPRIRSDGVERSRNFHEQRMAAAARLLDVVQDLERAHQAFERREKEEAANEILPP